MPVSHSILPLGEIYYYRIYDEIIHVRCKYLRPFSGVYSGESCITISLFSISAFSVEQLAAGKRNGALFRKAFASAEAFPSRAAICTTVLSIFKWSLAVKPSVM